MGQLAYDDYAQAWKVPGSGQPGSNSEEEKSAECLKSDVIYVERC